MTADEPTPPVQEELTDWQYVVMITLLRINDTLAALAEELRPGMGKKLYDLQNAGEVIMPDPKLSGEFGTGFEEPQSEGD